MAKPLANPEMFLEEYKTFERAVCSAEYLSNLSWVSEIDFIDSIFSLEKYIANEDVRDKIKVCRMLRNYIQHHPDAASFLSVTAEETAFLKEKTEEILSLDGMAKDVMVRCSIALTDKNTLLDFASAMSAKNLSVYPYQDKKGPSLCLHRKISSGHSETGKRQSKRLEQRRKKRKKCRSKCNPNIVLVEIEKSC